MGAAHGLIALALVAACSGDIDDAPHATEPRAIRGGTDDTVDVAVVGIVDDGSGATCTGTLIAPDLVLTAQHCVATVMGLGACAQASFGPAGAAARYYVTTRATLGGGPSDFHPTAEVRIPSGSGFCGRDLALLRLAAPVATAEAAPLAPRLSPAVGAGERYSAVGFGATDDSGTGSGQRRRRDGLTVACAPCPTTEFISDAEWRGEAGVCGGDSGGPALDAEGRVGGVASRGAVGCVDPVYTATTAHAAWLVDEAVRAAGLGGYAPPAWTGASPPDAGVDAALAADASGAPGDDGGCGVGRRGAGLAMAAMIATLRARRRRRA